MRLIRSWWKYKSNDPNKRASDGGHFTLNLGSPSEIHKSGRQPGTALPANVQFFSKMLLGRILCMLKSPHSSYRLRPTRNTVIGHFQLWWQELVNYILPFSATLQTRCNYIQIKTISNLPFLGSEDARVDSSCYSFQICVVEPEFPYPLL